MESKGITCGRIVLASRDHFFVWTEQGEVEATLGGRLRHVKSCLPCVGDWIVLREGNVIVDVLPRRTRISRKEPGRSVREQILAANLDVLFIVSGLDQDYNPRRLERYLVLAKESGTRPVILLNKADLQEDPEVFVRRTKEQARGVPVLAVSALEKRGLGEICRQVGTGETAALVGSSGVGKSSIVNALLNEDRQPIAEVREWDGRGRHRTTQRELFLIPGNWFLIDMPGLRELEPWAAPEQVDDAFADIAELAAGCRFRDCTHRAEPGCAVRNAAGLDQSRLAGYRKLKRELAFLERQSDIRLTRESRKRWKALEKEARRHPKRT